MNRSRLGKTLAGGVVAVAVLNTLSALSLPVPERRPQPAIVVLWLALLGGHAALYWFGGRMRERIGLGAYVAAQAAVIFTIGLAGVPVPVGLGLLMAFTAEVVVLAGARWGTIPITAGAIALFVINALIASDLYRATTAGLLLAVTGVAAHAVAALLRREPPAASGAAAIPQSSVDLTPRENEVLRALVSGARSSDIALNLGISERTVKAHLGSIYQKLGVESRTAAVAAAVKRRLV